MESRVSQSAEPQLEDGTIYRPFKCPIESGAGYSHVLLVNGGPSPITADMPRELASLESAFRSAKGAVLPF